MVSIEATNRITGEYVTMALYDPATKIAFIQFDHVEHRLRLYDTYTIQDDVMEELAGLGCQAIRITEVNRPEFPDTEYEVVFETWAGQPIIDYGFGAGPQYPLPASFVRRTQVA